MSIVREEIPSAIDTRATSNMPSFDAEKAYAPQEAVFVSSMKIEAETDANQKV